MEFFIKGYLSPPFPQASNIMDKKRSQEKFKRFLKRLKIFDYRD
jgi:hypothetical protein